MARHIRKDDQVIVTAGADKGQKGKVLRVITGENRVIVDGINVRRKHVKPTQSNPQGGVVSVAMPIHISNISPVDKNGKATRVRFETNKDGEKVRVAATTGETLSVLKKAK
ncbi:MAG: 50S ribosomal protein L24 [Phycisphaeraceae bacterium]|nr:50S ribosomal protein L24 [Phycisphaeraceae bacterium]